MAPNDPHLLVFMALFRPLPHEIGPIDHPEDIMDMMVCDFQDEVRKDMATI